jgi:hypothetical protein
MRDTDPPLPGSGSVAYGESSGRWGVVQLSDGVRYLAVAMMDQTRSDHALQSNAVHVRITFMERPLLARSDRSPSRSARVDRVGGSPARGISRT